MMRLSIGYPCADAEMAMLKNHVQSPQITTLPQCITQIELAQLQKWLIKSVHLMPC